MDPIIVPELPYPPEILAENQQASPDSVMIGLMFPTDASNYTGVTDWSEAATRIDINTIQRHIGMVEPIKYLMTANVDVIGNTVDNGNLL